MMKMTLTAQTAHEISRTAEKRFYEAAYAEAKLLVEGHVSRTIQEACDKGTFSVEFKFTQEGKVIWDYVRIILCHNEYKASIKQSEPVLVVKW
jgi:hypothetical protein